MAVLSGKMWKRHIEAWEWEWWCWQVFVKLPARGERSNLGRPLKKETSCKSCVSANFIPVMYLSRTKSHPGTADIWAVCLLQQALRSVGAAAKRRYVVCGNCRKLTHAQHTQLKTAGLLWRFSHITEQRGLKGNFEDHLVQSLCYGKGQLSASYRYTIPVSVEFPL